MPITSSAKKALRASKRKRFFNLAKKSNVKAAIKKFKDLAKAGKHTDAEVALKAAYQAFDKAAKTGLLKKNTAARRKSRLALSLQKAK